MLTFVVVFIACLCFPIIIPGVIGFAIGGFIGAILCYVAIFIILAIGHAVLKD